MSKRSFLAAIQDMIPVPVERLVNVHPREACAGEHCCIHNPSVHSLSDAPMQWRQDRRLMERVCVHGVGHPDPDDVAYQNRVNPDGGVEIHGCCGCCR